MLATMDTGDPISYEVLELDAAACRDLPRPSANPAVMRDDPTEGPPSGLHAKLTRAWDLLSGNY